MTTTADTTADREIVITRIYDAPRDTVFRAWTDPEQLRRWWAPDGGTTPHCTVDLRPGGKFHFCMRSADGRDFWGLGVYREIAAPERIVYVDSFSDKDGNVVAPDVYGMSAEHPKETVVTVTFEEHPRGTLVTVRHDVGPAPFAERGDMLEGWSQMLGRLGGDLARR